MRKKIKTKKQLIKRLNEIDRKCIDEGTYFYDFKTLFEASSNKLSAQDKLALKKAVDIGDKEAIEAVFQAKMAEDLDVEDELRFKDYTKADLVEFIKWNSNAPVKILNKASKEELEKFLKDKGAFDRFINTLDKYRDVSSKEKLLNKIVNQKESLKEKINSIDYDDEYESKLSDKEIIRRIFGSFGVKLFSIVNEFDGLISVNVDADGYKEVEDTLDREIFNHGFDIVDSNVGEPNKYTERETLDITLMKDDDYNEEDDLELTTDDMNGGQWFESLKEEINLNDYDDGYVELRDGKPQFVYNTLRDAKDGMFWSQMGDNEHDLGKHSYEIKKWENGKLKDLNESFDCHVEELFLPPTGIGWFDKMYRELSDSERAQMNHVIKNIFYVKDDELPSIDEGTLDRIVDKFLDTTINESYEDGEYDYFVVYKGKIMQGEYPTYSEAKRNAGEGCVIKGVIQYGGSEFEETEIFENYQFRNKYLKEDANQTKEFEYGVTIYIDASSQDDYFDYSGEYDFIDKEDIQYSLNSYMEKIYLGFPDFDFDIYEEDTTKDTIIETLYVDVPKEESITYEGLKDKLRKIINDWSYNTTVEVEQQTDVDDFNTHYIDIVATADIDTK